MSERPPAQPAAPPAEPLSWPDPPPAGAALAGTDGHGHASRWAARVVPPVARRVRPRAVHSLLVTHGAGLIAGASDNDPTTVATLAVIGASTGYRLAWLVLLLLPMLLAVQVLSARLGAVTGKNLAQLIRRHWGTRWVGLAVALVLAVNLVTIGADVEGGAAALALFTGWPWPWFSLPVVAAIGLLLVFGTYRRITRVLSYVMLLFVAYVGATILARPDWGDVVRHTLVPSFRWTPEELAEALSLLGTTLTSYVFVWQSVQAAEQPRPLEALATSEREAASGIGGTVVIFWFILVGTGATLGQRGQAVETAQDAAQALAPLAGPLAAALFGLGLLASAVLALAVLAATSGYIVAAAFGWDANLDTGLRREAWPFYAVVVGSLGLGGALAALGIAPIRLLFVAGIIGGLGTPVVLAMMLLLAGSASVLGSRRAHPVVLAVGWVSAAVITAAGAAFVLQPLLAR